MLCYTLAVLFHRVSVVSKCVCCCCTTKGKSRKAVVWRFIRSLPPLAGGRGKERRRESTPGHQYLCNDLLSGLHKSLQSTLRKSLQSTLRKSQLGHCRKRHNTQHNNKRPPLLGRNPTAVSVTRRASPCGLIPRRTPSHG